MQTATATATATKTPADCVLQAAQADPAPAAAALGISQQQVLNLAHLAAYLRAAYPPGGQRSFNMGWWSTITNTLGEARYGHYSAAAAVGQRPAECGTVACAAGHGPAAGLPGQPDEYWYQYAQRVFVGDQRELGDFLFSENWEFRDNTPRGAAARIAYALQHGANLPVADATVPLYADYLP